MAMGRVDLIAQNATLLDAEDQAEAAGILLTMARVNEITIQTFARLFAVVELDELVELLTKETERRRKESTDDG